MNNEKLKKANDLEKEIARQEGRLERLSIVKTGYMINNFGYWLSLKADNTHGEALNEFIDEPILDAVKGLLMANLEKKLIKLKEEFDKL